MNAAQWRTAGASVRGSSHEKADLPCQDAHLWTVSPQGIVIAWIADGAGSAPLADVGARTAVCAAVDAVCHGLDLIDWRPSASPPDDQCLQGLLVGALGAARQAIDAEATARSLASRDFASTLILVVASGDFVCAAQVGDGAVVAADREGRVFSVTSPAHGEYLNETVFLTSQGGVAAAQPIVWRGRLAHLAVFSDGLQMVALRMPSGEAHEGFFSPLFDFLHTHEDEVEAQAALASFLASPRLRGRTDDDVTLFLATRMA